MKTLIFIAALAAGLVYFFPQATKAFAKELAPKTETAKREASKQLTRAVHYLQDAGPR